MTNLAETIQTIARHFCGHEKSEANLPTLGRKYETTKLALELALPHDRVWHGVKLETGVRGLFKYVSHEDWGKIFANVLFGMPKYTEFSSCSELAIVACSRILERFGINTRAIACGKALINGKVWGHSWIWFYDELGWHQIDPDVGDVLDVRDPTYYANWLFC